MIRILAILAVLASPGTAQEIVCGPSASIMMALMQRYGEEVIETRDLPSAEEPAMTIRWHLWVNRQTGSWTLTGTHTATTCVGMAGRHYSGQDLGSLLKIDQPT